MRAAFLTCLILSSPALAERLLVCGYELQTTRAGVETDPGDVTGSAFIDTAPVHGGEAVARAVAVAGRRSSFRHYFESATPALYARVYARLEQPVNATTMFLLLRRSSAVPAIAWLTLDSQNNVRARVWVSDYGPIARLTVGVWHRFDLFVDERGGGGAHVVQIAMDGQPILLVTGLSLSHIVDQLEVGLNVNAELASSGVMLFDDVAVNGTVGADENGFPQPGQVFLMKPDGMAGTPAWTQGDGGLPTADNWQAVAEVPPDDAVTTLESRTNARVIDEFTVTPPPAIAATTPASLVMVGMRFAADGTTNRSIGVGLRAGGGALLQSSPVAATAITWYSNRADGYLNVPLAASRTPEGLPWSQAALDDLRIAVADADSNARPLMVTSVYAFAEFPVPTEPPPPIPGTGPAMDGGVDAGPDAGPVDAGTPDAGTSDAGADPDAGTSDAGADPDAGTEPDAGELPDAGASDGGDFDAGHSTGGQTDGGVSADGGSPERAPWELTVGCACGSTGELSLILLALALARGARRSTTAR